jgi:hypothetical protein
VSAPFTTAGLGVIPHTKGDAGNVVRRQAWEDAHTGGAITHEGPGQLGYTACWPGGEIAAAGYSRLGALMDELDRAEASGLCPLHADRS